MPDFVWSKVSRTSDHTIQTISSTTQQHTMLSNDNKLCNYLKLKLNRTDNDIFYKCSVANQAIKKPLTKNLFISVEYKPETQLHLAAHPLIVSELSVIEDTSVELFCNASALPNILSYQWFFNDIRLDDFTNLNTLKLAQLKRHQAGQYSCRAQNKHGVSSDSFRIEIICKWLN